MKVNNPNISPRNARRRSGRRTPRLEEKKKDIATIIEEQFARPITIRENGRERRVNVLQAIMLNLVAASLGGDRRAQKVMLKYRNLPKRAKKGVLVITVIGGLPKEQMPEHEMKDRVADN